MAEEKQLPSTEYSLKSISWHLKTLVEELKALNAGIAKMSKAQQQRGDEDLF